MQDQALRMGSFLLTNNSRLIVLAGRKASADCGSINWLMMSGGKLREMTEELARVMYPSSLELQF